MLLKLINTLRIALVTSCLNHDLSNLSGQWIHQPVAVGMDSIAEEDHVELVLGIDPDRSAGEAAVAEGAR